MTHLADALVLDFVEGQPFLDVVEVQDLLDTFLVLEDLLDTWLLEGRVARREQGDIAQVTNGVHDIVAEISNGLVKLVHWPVLLFLNREKRFLFIDFEVLAG